MKRAFIFALALVVLAPALQAADNGWPEDLGKIQEMVRANIGDIPYDRVKVRRSGKTLDISIKLKNVPRQFRSVVRQQAGDDDVFLATNLVELFEPSLDFDIVNFDLLPIADFIDYYFGFGVFNFGKKIKRKAIIEVLGPNGTEILNEKKKFKMTKNSLTLRFVEDGVSGPGLHALETTVGPWSMTSFFCASCG